MEMLGVVTVGCHPVLASFSLSTPLTHSLTHSFCLEGGLFLLGLWASWQGVKVMCGQARSPSLLILPRSASATSLTLSRCVDVVKGLLE